MKPSEVEVEVGSNLLFKAQSQLNQASQKDRGKYE